MIKIPETNVIEESYPPEKMEKAIEYIKKVGKETEVKDTNDKHTLSESKANWFKERIQIQYWSKNNKFTSQEVRLLHEEGAEFFQFINEQLTNEQRKDVRLYLKYNKHLGEVIKKW